MCFYKWKTGLERGDFDGLKLGLRVRISGRMIIRLKILSFTNLLGKSTKKLNKSFSPIFSPKPIIFKFFFFKKRKNHKIFGNFLIRQLLT